MTAAGEQTSRMLAAAFPLASSPQVGGLVLYRTGYAMFYFMDDRRSPFVIGMTPFGITALKPDFAETTGYRRVGLE